jgi:peptidoglycan hydrolase FlgJ
MMTPLEKLPAGAGLARSSAASQNADANTSLQNRKLRRQCQEFEAILVQNMFKSMRQTVPDGGLFEKDTSHDIFQDLMDTEMSRDLSTSQGVGIADALYRQLKIDPTKPEPK